MSVLKIYGLTEEEKTQLKQLAQNEMGEANVSKFLKKQLLDLIKKPQEITTIANVDDKKLRLEMKLIPKELAQLKAYAQNSHMTPNAFAVLLIKNFLYQHAPIPADISATLVQSNYQLLRIGRNLNQIARQLNAGEEASLSTVKISQLHQFIEKHTSTVHDVLRTNKRRFE